MASRTFFTSDTHFSHDLMIRLRGFDSAEEHDSFIVEQWNRIVRPNDIIFHMGDVTLKNVSRVRHVMEQLHGIKHLILGNHDRAHPCFKNSHNQHAPYREFFESVSLFGRIRINQTNIVLSHFPYEGESEEREDRLVEFRLRDQGIPLIHGHTHSGENYSRSDQGSSMIHVGWDAWERPVSEDEIREYIF